MRKLQNWKPQALLMKTEKKCIDNRSIGKKQQQNKHKQTTHEQKKVSSSEHNNIYMYEICRENSPTTL